MPNLYSPHSWLGMLTFITLIIQVSSYGCQGSADWLAHVVWLRMWLSNLCTDTKLAPQFIFGFAAFLFPKYSAARRAQVAPLHHFAGRSVFVLGLATMAVRPQLIAFTTAVH